MRILVLIFMLCVPIFAQTEREKVLNQQLNKALDSIEVQDRLIKAQDGEIAALKRELETKDRLILLQERQNELLMEQNAKLAQLKCDTTSFLFGLIKKKRCR